MNYKFFILQFIFWSNLCVLAQNPIWVCPPNVINAVGYQPLPTGPATNQTDFPEDFYDANFRLEGSANGISKPNGDILFFIVDGLIYDGNGEFKDYAFSDNVSTISSPVNPIYKIKYNNHLRIGPETIIVPHPVNCGQYYIFSSLVEQTFLKDQPIDTIPPDPQPEQRFTRTGQSY